MSNICLVWQLIPTKGLRAEQMEIVEHLKIVMRMKKHSLWIWEEKITWNKTNDIFYAIRHYERYRTNHQLFTSSFYSLKSTLKLTFMREREHKTKIYWAYVRNWHTAFFWGKFYWPKVGL